jgi:hypothetical protein
MIHPVAPAAFASCFRAASDSVVADSALLGFGQAFNAVTGLNHLITRAGECQLDHLLHAG